MSEKPAVRSGVAVGEALRGVARSMLSDARDILQDHERPDAVAVHDYRKAMKRWRALLRLLEPPLGDSVRQLRVEARDAARELAGARDAQSAIDALDDLLKSGAPPSTRTVASIRGRLEAVRRDAEQATLSQAGRERLIAALDAADTTVAAWPLDKLNFKALAGEMAKTYERMREDSPKKWRTAEPDTLHDLRRYVVAHRYQMELVEPLWPKFGELWVDEAQRLRDRLGTFQDLSVLLGFTVPHAPLAPWRSRLTPLILNRRAAHAKAAQRIAARLLAERPKDFRRRLEALWKRRKH